MASSGSPGLSGSIPPAEREVGDVDLVAAQHRADVPDDAGHVLVPHVDQVARQRRLAVDAVHLQQAGLAQHDRALHGGDAGVGLQFQPDRVHVAGALLVPLRPR